MLSSLCNKNSCPAVALLFLNNCRMAGKKLKHFPSLVFVLPPPRGALQLQQRQRRDSGSRRLWPEHGPVFLHGGLRRAAVWRLSRGFLPKRHQQLPALRLRFYRGRELAMWQVRLLLSRFCRGPIALDAGCLMFQRVVWGSGGWVGFVPLLLHNGMSLSNEFHRLCGFAFQSLTPLFRFFFFFIFLLSIASYRHVVHLSNPACGPVWSTSVQPVYCPDIEARNICNLSLRKALRGRVWVRNVAKIAQVLSASNRPRWRFPFVVIPNFTAPALTDYYAFIMQCFSDSLSQACPLLVPVNLA